MWLVQGIHNDSLTEDAVEEQLEQTTKPPVPETTEHGAVDEAVAEVHSNNYNCATDECHGCNTLTTV